ncbi:MAG: glutathione S-transferase family protein [Rhizobiales bacterium]|jgi:glutathione S-transferase|nr:glutathione S-transferase family protein [Hyphomicrobiales bacterium]
MPILYHHPLSAGSRFVRLVLAEYGETVEFVERHPLERDEEYLILNPAGTLPVLVDEEDGAICGPVAIAEYLCETRGHRLGEATLMPRTPAERAEVRRLVSWFLDKFDSEVTEYLVTEKVLKRTAPRGNGGSPDAAAIRAARNNIRYHLRYVGYLVARRNCLAGRSISLADLAGAAHLSCIDYLGEVPWDEDAMAKQWYARVKSRPSFRPILADTIRGNPPASHYVDLDF